MRVLLLFTSSQLGGAERSLTRMALEDNNVDYFLATLDAEGPWCTWLRSLNKKPLVFGSGNGNLSLLWSIYRLFKFIRTSDINILYVCGARASFIIRILRFFIPETKIINGIRWNPSSNSRLDVFSRVSERFLNAFIDAYITNSQAAKNTLIERCGITDSKITVIYNGIDLPLGKGSSLFSRPINILTVANFNPRKGHVEYLEVVKNVLNIQPEVHFIFVGRDDMNSRVQHEIIKEGLENNISCVGFQSDISQYYKEARLFVLPSLWGEGCPTSILEAMSYGVPVVAYSVDGVMELISERKDGRVIEVKNYQKMSDAIIELLKNTKLSIKYGLAGQKKVSELFTLIASANNHEQVYTRLLNKSS